MKFNVSFGMRILLLLCLFVFFYVVMNVGAHFVANERFGSDGTRVMRIILIFQAVLAFIVPAVATAVLVTRQPARLLAIDTMPNIKITIAALATLAVAMPLLGAAMAYNEALPLPDNIAEVMKQGEKAASQSIETVIGVHNIPSFIVAALVLGVMAGLSEELFFRGGLQRLLVTGHTNVHVAIWLTAIIFSAMHMQIYGFVPRMLLGAFLGYALYWSGSVWLPVLLHICNNVSYLVLEYSNPTANQAKLPAGEDWVWVIGSVVLTALGMYMMWRQRQSVGDGYAKVVDAEV